MRKLLTICCAARRKSTFVGFTACILMLASSSYATEQWKSVTHQESRLTSTSKEFILTNIHKRKDGDYYQEVGTLNFESKNVGEMLYLKLALLHNYCGLRENAWKNQLKSDGWAGKRLQRQGISVSGKDGLESLRIGLAAKKSFQENRPVKLNEIE